MFYKKGVLRKFCKNHRKIPVLDSLNNVSGLLRHRYFLVSFAEILRTSFLVNTCGGYFFQVSPNLKRRRTVQRQFTNELETKQITNSKLFFLTFEKIRIRTC